MHYKGNVRCNNRIARASVARCLMAHFDHLLLSFTILSLVHAVNRVHITDSTYGCDIMHCCLRIRKENPAIPKFRYNIDILTISRNTMRPTTARAGSWLQLAGQSPYMHTIIYGSTTEAGFVLFSCMDFLAHCYSIDTLSCRLCSCDEDI